MSTDTDKKTRFSRRGIYLLPNLLTTAALFAGFYSVVAAMDGAFFHSAVAIFVAMVLDGLDGRVARLTGTDSDFGKEYDSLCDMISFGLAPALVVYQWGMVSIADSSIAWGKLGWLVAFFYAVCAALRLARFNSRPVADKRFFEGLPTPCAAGIVGGWMLLATQYDLTGTGALVLAFISTALAAILMVSNFRYYGFKEFNLGERIPFTRALLIPAVFVLIFLNPPIVMFVLFGVYAVSGPLIGVVDRLRGRRRSAGTESDAATNAADTEQSAKHDKTA